MNNGISGAGDMGPMQAGISPDAMSMSRNPPQSENSECVDQLNSYLRGEIAAAETYRMAIDKLLESGEMSPASIGSLREIHEHHGRSAQELRERIRELGGEPADSSGAWGAWAKLAMGAAKLFGDAAALRSLKDDEMHGLHDFQEGLGSLDVASAELVQNHLIPAQQRHLIVLDQLINGLA